MLEIINWKSATVYIRNDCSWWNNKWSPIDLCFNWRLLKKYARIYPSILKLLGFFLIFIQQSHIKVYIFVTNHLYPKKKGIIVDVLQSEMTFVANLCKILPNSFISLKKYRSIEIYLKV